MDREALLLGALAAISRDRRRGGLLVGRSAPVEGRDRVLVLAAHAQPLVLGRVRARGELAHARGPRRELGVDLGAGRARAQQLAAVVADVGDRPDRDDLARGRSRAGRSRTPTSR